MRYFRLIGFAAVLLGAVACGQTTQEEKDVDVPDGWKVVNEKEFVIQYPDSFDLDMSGQMGMSLILLSKQVNQQDLFRENINLVIQDLSGQDIDLDKYTEISEEQIKTLITNSNIIESRRVKIDNSEFQKIIYTGTQGQFNLTFEQYYWVVKDSAYVLTLTCEEDQYQIYKDVGEEIIDSFRIK